MTIIESAQRQAVIAEAETWLGTPFHHRGRVKGQDGGVDCAMLLLEVFKAAGLVEKDPPPLLLSYSEQWHLHHSEERYINLILALGGREIPFPRFGDKDMTKVLPGDIAVWKIGRAYSHGAIVVAWPQIIHACVAPVNKCIRDDALHSPLNLTKYPVKFFTAWGL